MSGLYSGNTGFTVKGRDITEIYSCANGCIYPEMVPEPFPEPFPALPKSALLNIAKDRFISKHYGDLSSLAWIKANCLPNLTGIFAVPTNYSYYNDTILKQAAKVGSCPLPDRNTPLTDQYYRVVDPISDNITIYSMGKYGGCIECRSGYLYFKYSSSSNSLHVVINGEELRVDWSSNCSTVIVDLVGGGGAGGGGGGGTTNRYSGSGGGGGGFITAFIKLKPDQIYRTYTGKGGESVEGVGYDGGNGEASFLSLNGGSGYIARAFGGNGGQGSRKGDELDGGAGGSAEFDSTACVGQVYAGGAGGKSSGSSLVNSYTGESGSNAGITANSNMLMQGCTFYGAKPITLSGTYAIGGGGGASPQGNGRSSKQAGGIGGGGSGGSESNANGGTFISGTDGNDGITRIWFQSNLYF